MTVTLPPELEKLVRERIERGDYESADALVQEALYRLVEEDEHTTKDLARAIHERGDAKARRSSSP